MLRRNAVAINRAAADGEKRPSSLLGAPQAAFLRTQKTANYLAIECYNHTTNATFFENWVDNASFHRKDRWQKLANRAGIALLFLYSDS